MTGRGDSQVTNVAGGQTRLLQCVFLIAKFGGPELDEYCGATIANLKAVHHQSSQHPCLPVVGERGLDDVYGPNLLCANRANDTWTKLEALVCLCFLCRGGGPAAGGAAGGGTTGAALSGTAAGGVPGMNSSSPRSPSRFHAIEERKPPHGLPHCGGGFQKITGVSKTDQSLNFFAT